MGDKKKKKEDKVLIAEFKISMHCNACERSVAKAISKVKGVESFMTDMTKHKVVVTGKINPQKVMKKLKKKTGKKVEILIQEDAKNEKEKDAALSEDCTNHVKMNSFLVGYCDSNEYHMMFNDENPNACTIM